MIHDDWLSPSKAFAIVRRAVVTIVISRAERNKAS